MADPTSLPIDFDARFGGIARLYGRPALEAFQRAHVAVVGIGGVGSWVAEALARSGIGALSLMDLDDICLTNTNRQVHALTDTVGKAKISVMAQRLKAINPALVVHELPRFYGESTADAFFATPYAAIVDAIDSVRQKTHLIDSAHARAVPLVTVGGAGGRTDPTRIQTADLSQSHGDRLLMLVRKQLRTRHGFPREGKGRFRVPCVFSDEPPRYPWADGSVCAVREPNSPGGIHCDSGMGSATHVTAAMAFFATGIVLKTLASAADKAPLRTL
jgi:tRNA A37 threonylcarbamoyladenosine dehydratase